MADISFTTEDGRFHYRVGCVLTDGDRLLVMRDEGTSAYYLPGGRVHFGERVADAAVRESVQRVTSALTNSSFFRPGDMAVTVNLAPADVRKQGPGFDLPIALALEMAIQENYRDVPEAFKRRVPVGLDAWCFVGELALDGVVRGVPLRLYVTPALS